MRSIVGATLAGLILLAACGGDDDDKDNADSSDNGDDTASTATEQEYIDAIAAGVQNPAANVPLDEATATCLATAMVEAVGVSNFQDAGVDPEELAAGESLESLEVDVPDDAADTIAAGVKDCGAATLFRDGFFAQLAADLPTGLPADAQQCVQDGLSDDAIAEAIGADFANETSEYSTLLLTAVGKCPVAAAGLVLSQSPPDIPAEARTCVESYINDNSEHVADTFADGAEDGLDELIADVREACPDAQIPE